MKVDIEKLIAALKEAGVEEEKIEAIVESLKGESEEESAEAKPEEGGNPDEAPVEEEPSEESDPVPAPEEEEPVVPVEEPVAADPASVPPVEEGALPPAEELPPVAPEEAVPAVEPELPPVVSLEEFNAVKSELEEYKKANEGLEARLSSLEEALKGAGIIEGESQVAPIGSETPVVPTPSADDTTMDDVLRAINHKGY